MIDAGAFSVGLGAMTLIKTVTISSAAGTSNFIHGTSSVVLNNTYPIYKFVFSNIHSGNNDVLFQCNFAKADNDFGGGAPTKTSTLFQAENDETAANGRLAIASGGDILHNETNFQVMTRNMGNGNDECMSGELFLFNPSSTTFVKHFMFKTNINSNDDSSDVSYGAGYINNAAAITGLSFEFSAGNIDSGIIKLYGIKDS